MSHDHDDHGDSHGHDHDARGFDWAAMAALAELEGEVFEPLTSRAIARLAGLGRAQGLDVGRVLDLGCGPGVGTGRLAATFPSADVVAVDASAAMLERAAARAGRLGLASQVTTRLAELPADLDALGRADVAWASMSLHHIDDPGLTLRQIHEFLAPTGLLAIVEFAGPLRVLPDGTDLGRPGLWERLDAAWAAWLAEMRAGPTGTRETADERTMLDAAGFEVLADEVLELDLEPPLDDRARRFAHEHVVRTQRQLSPHADATDLAALDGLVDEDGGASILRRDDALVHASRHLYVARAAGDDAG